MAGEGLMLAFGDLDDDKVKRAEIGQLVKDVLQESGLTVEWNGDPETRLNLREFVWKRRRTV